MSNNKHESEEKVKRLMVKRIAFLAYYIIVSSIIWFPPFFQNFNRPTPFVLGFPPVMFWTLISALLVAVGLIVQYITDEKGGYSA